ncbi:addiction module protein [Massilia horti]|uniref:Addiction module component n=1 Tax=Massilia horti TaxID=2562153 RepID=A0A4Y9T623_9BURK|nr:addiction module protein [Massilia horti]TFW35819.1 hypothetical protein E4O92_01315 [Massilia horti]
MHTQFERLAMEVLQLTPDEREAFVQLLVASLEEDVTSDDALAAEVERRNADVECAVTQVIPMHEALASVRAGLK